MELSAIKICRQVAFVYHLLRFNESPARVEILCPLPPRTRKI